jgi:HTH-type transcriptional regulator/antitoxin HigA
MTMALAERREYLDLVRDFPPRPIHTTRDYERTLAVMNKLAVRDEDSLSPAEADYLDALATFVEQYDSEHFPESDTGTPVERLHYLMDQSGMSASDLGRLLGNRGLGSILLAGKRELSKTHIRLLANHFKLSTDYFF